MKHDGLRSDRRVAAVLLRAMPLVCLACAAIVPAMAQDSLPSVNDYRLPSPSASPRTRPQGPIDADNPVVVTPRTAPESPATAAPAPAASARPAAPAATASPRPSPRPTQTARAGAVTTSTANPTTSAASSSAPAVGATAPVIAPATETAPQASTAAPAVVPFEWRVQADDGAAGQYNSIWPWLAGLAFLLGGGAALFLQRAWIKRQAQGAQEQEHLSAGSSDPAIPDAALDLTTPLVTPEPQPIPMPAPAPRPALGVYVNPLVVALSARRLSATLMNAVLNYELVISNKGREAIGPITVGGDMIGAHASLPESAQLELNGQEIMPLHRLTKLEPGESMTLTGEFKLPLAAITPIRSGKASLFIPLARFRVEAARAGAPPLVANSAFVIGEDQDQPGAALKPFRLDLGPRLYSRIGQRELAQSA